MTIAQFPSTERGEQRMAHATLDSSRPRILREPKWPATCGRSCAHLTCMEIRAHWRNRQCSECLGEIEAGQEYVERDGVLKHESCPERTV